MELTKEHIERYLNGDWTGFEFDDPSFGKMTVVKETDVKDFWVTEDATGFPIIVGNLTFVRPLVNQLSELAFDELPKQHELALADKDIEWSRALGMVETERDGFIRSALIATGHDADDLKNASYDDLYAMWQEFVNGEYSEIHTDDDAPPLYQCGHCGGIEDGCTCGDNHDDSDMYTRLMSGKRWDGQTLDEMTGEPHFCAAAGCELPAANKNFFDNQFYCDDHFKPF